MSEVGSSSVRRHAYALSSGLITLGILFAFWIQADIRNPLGAHFPNAVMLVLLVLGVALLAVRPVEERREFAGVTPGGLLFALAVAGAWVWLLPILGFLLSSLLAFLGVSFARSDERTPKSIVVNVAGSVLIVGACYSLLTWVLRVRLPDGILFG